MSLTTQDDWKKAGKDVVVLHQFGRSKVIPNISPFCLKIETYLRMANIEYMAEFKNPLSSKGKSPWITFNGEDMADSQLCMEHLAKMLGKDLSAHLTPQERAAARGMRAVLEDHFYFCMALERWVYGDLNYVTNAMDIATAVTDVFSKNFKQQCNGQGIGRHTEEEVRVMGLNDLKSVSEYLSTKQYMTGDQPTEIDCVVFGFTANFLFAFPTDCVYRMALEGELANLREHCLRVKEKYWPDWDEVLLPSSKKEA